MEKELNNSINDLVDYIVNTDDYKKCIYYKELMDKDDNLKELVNKIKKLQKKYVNGLDESIKEELEHLEEELNNNEVYVIYNQYLEKVNIMINYVKEDLNDYFYDLFNS